MTDGEGPALIAYDASDGASSAIAGVGELPAPPESGAAGLLHHARPPVLLVPPTSD